MGVYTRPDSPFYWLWLETAPKAERRRRTNIPIGHTATERKANHADALAVYGAAMSAIGKGTHDLPVASAPVTFNAVADDYVANVLPLHRGHAREREILTALRVAFGAVLVGDPRWPDLATAWRTKRRTTGTRRIIALKSGKTKTRTYAPPKAATVNREFGVLQLILAHAARLKHIPVSPLLDWPDLEEAEPLRRTTSDDEERRLLAELTPIDQAIYIMATDTLARFGDCLDLRYQDDHGGQLHLLETKNGDPVIVAVSTRLRAALDAIPPVAGQDYVFAARRTAPTPESRRHSYMTALQAACRRAGVPYGRKHHGVTFHWATRRTGASRMLRRLKGRPDALGIVQKIGAWKTLTMLTGQYQEVTVDDQRDAVEAAAPTPATPTKAGRKQREYYVSGTPKNEPKADEPRQRHGSCRR